VFVPAAEWDDKLTDADFYRVYVDHTYFEYQVVLTRDNKEAEIEGERYILTVSMLCACCFGRGLFIPTCPFFYPP
jgi:hypothetical protein